MASIEVFQGGPVDDAAVYSALLEMIQGVSEKRVAKALSSHFGGDANGAEAPPLLAKIVSPDAAGDGLLLF